MSNDVCEDEGQNEIDAHMFGPPGPSWPSGAVRRRAEDLARSRGYDELSERWNTVVSWYAGQLREEG